MSGASWTSHRNEAPVTTASRRPDDDLDRLRHDLARHVREHPPSTWSPRLLRLVDLALSLEFAEQESSQDELPRRLRLV
jgi:hypothetical protein